MDPQYWGAPFWRLMHVLVRDHYDPQTTPDLILLLGKCLLPCKKCRKHFATRLKRRPVPKKRHSASILQRWLVGVHNEVNREKGKKVYTEVAAFNEIARMRSVACHVPFVLHAIKVNIEGTRMYEKSKKCEKMQASYEKFIVLLHKSLRKSCARMWSGSHCWSWLVQPKPFPLPNIDPKVLAVMRNKRKPSKSKT